MRASPQNPSSSDIGGEESQGAAFWCSACQKQWERRSPGSFVRIGSTSGSDTRYHARVRPGGVNKECASRLLMWRNASRLFSVEVAAYEPILGALSINATMCEPMELFAAVRSALLQRCEGEVAYLVSAVGLSFGTLHVDGAHVRYWFGEVKAFPQVSLFVTGIFLWYPGREGAGRWLSSRSLERQTS